MLTTLVLETITNYTDYADIQYYMKNNSSLTTLTTLIWNTRYNFITDYADFRDYTQYIKNNFTSDYTNYADFQYQIRNNFITDYAD